MRGFERGRAIELKIDAPVFATCDGSLIRRVLENLVSNAIKHAPSSSCVQIVATSTAQRVRVEVCDEGRGVPLEARERIFDKFESAAVRKESEYHSAGLGLAFCKLVIEAHQGKIGVDAREPQGSCFWFELPSQTK